MAFSFSSGSVESLKNQINIVDVIGRVIQLKRAGNNYKGVCPFHNEKTPSFVVSETKQIFTCFGCGATGDVIEFVKRYYNLDFNEAVEKLSSEYGIVLEKHVYNDNRDVYYDVNRKAAQFFYRSFTEKANKGYSYMKNRGIENNILKKFGIGYADEEWHSLYDFMMEQGVSENILVELGLISVKNGKKFDRFRNRVIFPIINTSGKVIGFGGRALGDDGAKYLNSPESKIFQKKNNLYGLNISRQDVGKEGCAILVEGYMDVISLYQSGVKNVAASLGTALTENQAKLLKRYTKEVILSYDADSAGRAAALRGLDVLSKEECKVKVLHVTDGKDPDEFIKKNGRMAFLNLLGTAVPLVDYKLNNCKEGFDLNKTEDKIDYIKKAVVVLGELSPVEQDIYVKKLASDLKISDMAIRKEVIGKEVEEKNSYHRGYMETEEHIEELEFTVLEKNLIKLMMTDEKYISRIKVDEGILTSDLGRRVFTLLSKQVDEARPLDIKLMYDELDTAEISIIKNIDNDVVLGGKDEEVFTECLRTYKYTKLLDEEKITIMRLSLTDEENNNEEIKKLSEKLMEIQDKKKLCSRGNL